MQQLLMWGVLAPLFGIVQAVASFAPVMLQNGQLESPDLHHLIVGVSLVYGSAWFLPALLLSDLLFLKRRLTSRELLRYAVGIGLAAFLVGILTPGPMLMLGFPATAAVILAFGYMRRFRSPGILGTNL